MKKTEQNYDILATIFLVTLVISNVVTGKIIDTGIVLFDAPLTIAGAVLCYPITYLITDVIGEIWGKQDANRLVRLGFIGQVVATTIIMCTTFTPCIDDQMQNAYVKLLGQNWVFVVGSLSAYLISQHLDVTIFHKIRSLYLKKHSSTKGGRWIWNNISTCTSQLVDTMIFILIAFGIGFGWLWSNPQALINMAIGQYIVKFLIALFDTPFFYFLTRGHLVGNLS